MEGVTSKTAASKLKLKKVMSGIRQIRSKPGLLFDPVRKKYFKITDVSVHARYDTGAFVGDNTGSVPFGTQISFAQNIQNKQEIDCNFKQPRRLTAGEVMWVSHVGLYWPLFFGNTKIDTEDIRKIVENAYFLLKINNKEILKGPALHFPSGFGFTGQFALAADGASSEVTLKDGVVSVGVPSLPAVKPLAKKIYLNENYDVDGVLTLQNRSWIQYGSSSAYASPPTLSMPGAIVPVRMILFGLLYSPSTV